MTTPLRTQGLTKRKESEKPTKSPAPSHTTKTSTIPDRIHNSKRVKLEEVMITIYISTKNIQRG